MYTCLLVVVAGIYFFSLSDLLLDMDDVRTFLDNAAVDADWTYFFSSNKEVSSGRFTADLFHFLNYLLVGNQPGPVHLLLVGLHTATTLLLTRLLWRLGTPLALSFMSGLLFLVNVAHFRAVHWISAQDYTLALALGCVTLLTYLRYREEQRPLFLGLFYLCLLLDAMAHLAIFFILPFFVYVLWRRGQPVRACLWHFAWPLMGAPLMLYGVLHFTSRSSSTWWSLERYVSTNMVDLVLGCGKVLLWLSSRLWTTAHWLPLPLYEFQVWELYVGGLVLLLLVLAIWKRVEPVDLWGVWILLSLLPFALLTEETVVPQPSGPSRYLYMATAGSSVLLAWGLMRLGEGAGRRFGVRSAYVLAGLLVSVLVSSYVYLKKVEAFSFYMSGRNYIAEGKIDLGIVQIQRALDQAPDVLDLEDTYARLTLLLLSTGGNAQIVLDEAVELFPDNLTLSIYGYVMESMSPDSTARARSRQKLAEIAQKVVGEDTKNFPELVAGVYHNMGLGLYASNDVEGAIQAYRRALEFAPDRLKILKNLATALFSLERWEDAQALVQPHHQASRDDPSVLYLNALRAIFEEEIDEAIALCQQALDLRPSGDVFYLLSHCYVEKNQLDDALEALHEAVRLMGDKTTYRTHFQLGTLYYRLGEFDRAVDAYRRAIHLFPQDFEPHADLGTALMELGHLEEAERAYRQAILFNMNHPELYHNLGVLKLKQGDRQEAFKAFQMGVKKGSRNIHTYWALGRLYWRGDQRQQALETFRQILHLDLQQEDSEIYAQTGVLFNETGELDNAIRAYHKALEIDAHNALVRVNLGWIYYTRGQFDAAVAEYQQVLDQQAHCAAQFSLGLAYLHQGQIETARTTYARGIEQFGATAAAEVGAAKDLQNLIARGIRATEARDILNTYWHE